MKTLIILAAGMAFGLASPSFATAEHSSRDMVVLGHAGSISPAKARMFVTMLYNAILFRDPEPGGLAAWSRQVVNGGYRALIQAAGAIANSPEFHNDVEPLHYADEILENFYYVLLQRPVDPVGYEGWLPYVETGRANVAAEGIVSSPEFRRLYGVY